MHILMKGQMPYSAVSQQEIVDTAETEIFAKEPELARLFRELKSMPVRRYKKVHWFSLYVCNPKFTVFWCVAVG